MERSYSDAKKFIFTFYSDILESDVIDNAGNVVGKVHDVHSVVTEIYPKAVELVIKRGFLAHEYAVVSWSSLEEIDGQVRLKINEKNLKFVKSIQTKNEISWCYDLLDQQVVDTHNRRVVRVNDLHLLKIGMDLMVAHIDIGMRGIVRRLGWTGVIDSLVSIFRKNSLYLRNENFISWKYVQVLSVNPASSTLKVSVPYSEITKIHPVELSEIIKDLDPDEKVALFKALNLETKAKVFEDLDLDTQHFLMSGMETNDIAKLITLLPTDEAADFLDHLPKENVNQLLSMLESGRAKKLSTLLGYESDTAGGLMTTEYIAVAEKSTVKDVLEKVKSSALKSEMIYYVYIVDEKNHLLGSTTLKRLLSCNPDDPVMGTALPKTAIVHLNDDVKEVAFLIEKYRLFAMPVADDDNVLQGIITVDDILEQLLALVWKDHESRL